MELPELTAAEYKAMQDRVGTITRLIVETDALALQAFIATAEKSDALGPYLDPTLWMAGHEDLRRVIGCAYAVRDAGLTLVEVLGAKRRD
jgi:hypothetical protein